MGCNDCNEVSFPICITKGANFVLQVLYRDADDLPINITNYTARMQGRVTVNSDETIFDFSTDVDGGITINGVLGIIQINVPPAMTSVLDAIAKAVYDLFLYPPSPSTDAEIILSGPVSIREAVTRPDA